MEFLVPLLGCASSCGCLLFVVLVVGGVIFMLRKKGTSEAEDGGQPAAEDSGAPAEPAAEGPTSGDEDKTPVEVERSDAPPPAPERPKRNPTLVLHPSDFGGGDDDDDDDDELESDQAATVVAPPAAKPPPPPPGGKPKPPPASGATIIAFDEEDED